MGIALQARSTNAPREVELNCLRVLNLTRQVKRHVGHANDALQLREIGIRFALLRRERKTYISQRPM
jgi:hypothetical protein